MAVRNINPNNEDVQFGPDTIEVAGTSFRAAEIQDVKVVPGSTPRTAKRRALLAAFLALLALATIGLNLAGVLPEDLQRLSRLFIAVFLLGSAAMPIPEVLRRKTVTIQIITNGEQLQVLESADLQYLSQTAVRLRVLATQAKHIGSSSPG